MALLKCIECNHDVSEYADKCTNCGCPIDIIKKHINDSKQSEDGKLYTIINGEKKDVTYFVKTILETENFFADPNIDTLAFNLKLMDELDVVTIDFFNAVMECQGAPKEFNGESVKAIRAKRDAKEAKQAALNATKPKCPHCQSTNISKISGTERAVSVIGLGILSNKINKSFKCKSCGYTW